jgi:hypothetical protein
MRNYELTICDKLQVKLEKLRQLQQQQQQQPQKTFNTKTSPKTQLHESDPNSNERKRIRLEDLTWEEKERVLRILFSKINSMQYLPLSHLYTHPLCLLFR